MALFAITFRIHEDATYQDRYDSLVEVLKAIGSGGKYWDEPTSFFLITSTRSAADLATLIRDMSNISEQKDLVFIMNVSAPQYSILGVFADKDVHELMKQR